MKIKHSVQYRTRPDKQATNRMDTVGTYFAQSKLTYYSDVVFIQLAPSLVCITRRYNRQ